MRLTSNFNDCATIEEYQRTKEQYESLINRQLEGDRKPLISTLKFWDSLKYKWAATCKSNLHAIPNASWAEAAQASMKASNEKSISLVNSIFADISDSARLDAKWKNRLLGEHCRGRWQSSLELEDRYELRQIDRANRYVVEKSYQVDDLMDDDSDLPPVISTQKCKHCTRLPASSLPKVKITRIVYTRKMLLQKQIKWISSQKSFNVKGAILK